MKDEDSRTVENDDERKITVHCPVLCIFTLFLCVQTKSHKFLNFLHQNLIFMTGITMK